MSSNKTAVVVAAGVVAATCAVVYVVVKKSSKKKDEEEEDVFSFASSPTSPAERKAVTSITVSEKVTVDSKAFSARKEEEVISPPAKNKKTESDSDLDGLLAETMQEILGKKEPSAEKISNLSTNMEMEDVHYPFYGLHMKIPAGWSAVEGPPATPTVAMIQISAPETSDGSYILLAIEDVSSENLLAEEYIQVMKNTAMETMYFMTNGVQPVQRKDEAVSVGPFTHVLEFVIAHPMMSLMSTNLIAMKNGMTYNLQMLGSPNGDQLDAFQKIAASVTIDAVKGSPGCLEVILESLSLSLEATWNWKGVPKDGKGLAVFGLNSKLRSEDVTLYMAGDEPEEFVQLSPEREIDDVQITSSLTKDRKRISFGKYSMCITSQNGPSRVPESTVIRALKSIAPRKSDKTSVAFIKDSKYKFKVAPGSGVMASVLSRDTVVYYPKGMPQQQAPEDALSVPTAVVRMSLEQECNTLDEWRAQIEEDSPEATFREEEVCGHVCLKVETSEMMEIGMGQKTEVRSLSLVFVVNGNSYLIRWELATGEWKKHEREFDRFLEGFEFL